MISIIISLLLFHHGTGKPVTCSASFIATSYMNGFSRSPGEMLEASGFPHAVLWPKDCVCFLWMLGNQFFYVCVWSNGFYVPYILQRCSGRGTVRSRTRVAAKYLLRI